MICKFLSIGNILLRVRKLRECKIEEMESHFPQFLRDEMKKLDMTQAELSRRSGISEAQISRVISGSPPGEEFCRKVAKALKIAPETVFIAAGILPQKSEELKLEDWRYILSQLPEQDREELLEMAKLRLKQVDARKTAKALFDWLRTLSPEEQRKFFSQAEAIIRGR